MHACRASPSRIWSKRESQFVALQQVTGVAVYERHAAVFNASTSCHRHDMITYYYKLVIAMRKLLQHTETLKYALVL
jgi:hypothetical protein